MTAPALASAEILLRQLASNPKNRKLIDYLMSQGLKPEDIARYVSGEPMSPS